MGWMKKLRSELIEVIEWVDDSRHTIMWRFPRYRNQIKYGAQLIVRPGQLAIFVRQGEIADVFEPGQYRLETRNLPILSTLAGWKYGFDSPFKAEVYFASTRQITDLKWGTPNPVVMRDPDFGSVRVRAFGTYTLKAADPRRLLEELVGTDSSFDADEISELLRSIISTAFADVVAKSEIGLLDLASSYRTLSEEVRRIVLERIDDEYGLAIPQLYIVNISVPAEVEQALDTRSSMSGIGDLAAFQSYQLGQSMPTAAANPAGQTPPPPPAPPAWHVAENGGTSGPFSFEQMAQAIAAGRLRPETTVWTAGMAGWAAAAERPELRGLFRAVPPVPPAEDD